MADAVTTRVLLDSPQQYAVRLMSLSDGTGESDVVKVDKSAIGVAAPVGSAAATEAVSLEFESIRWNIQGFTSVTLEYDHTTDDVAYRLCGSGYDEPGALGGLVKNFSSTPGAVDPRTTGGTGDILLTTEGEAAGATYDITILFRKATV